ncbi:S8 family peptidase [Streptomyces jumonjinensis]|uniref:S8 family peptidase n=1 Tax=Streptomyces jumonjinensis TaxID=1945 RepID=UPI00379800D1
MVAAAAAVALTAGMTGPASAEGNARSGASAAAQGRDVQRVTLITGDVVLVDGKGRVAGVERAKGRENVPIQTRTAAGQTYVVPVDASALISSGKLDARLFNIAELIRSQGRDSRDGRDGLKLIVAYRGGAAKSARAQVRAAGDTEVRRSLASLNADAVTTPDADAGELWDAVTRTVDGRRATASGISRVWLDGVRKATLNKSARQIGAPTLWERHVKGKGVTVAVLDTGIDDTHDDLKGQVKAAENFTSSPDAKDRYGHGTHVAGTVAGTGAKSGGTHTGIAPEATLLNAKVLDDTGSGDESGIIAGIDWAVAQNADIINLSVGGYDFPEEDPLEAHVNKVSEEKGTLFAISAGNEGPGARTVGSPGSAEAALTVGAVNDKDKLASFSSRGPRVGDGGLKPDVTAPGVNITAAAAPGSLIEQEVGQKPEGYLSISGTSMAAPHAAGAAALLKQQYPDWKAKELKGALTGSTIDGGYTAFEQGSGRISVDQAINQQIVSEPASVGFGVQQWPHTDDTPVTKKVTYRNLNAVADIELQLEVSAKDPKGKPAPDGFFTLGAKTLTVPANGTATVDLTADTQLGGTLDGHYSAVVTANGGGSLVRTAAAVDREVESYDVTVKALDRDGAPTANTSVYIDSMEDFGFGQYVALGADGTAKARLPKGLYILEGMHDVDPDDHTKGYDYLVHPKLTVSKKATISLDARKAKPVDITVPDAKAVPYFAATDYTTTFKGGSYSSGLIMGRYDRLRTAHLGPEVTDGSLSQFWQGQWRRGKHEYNTVVGGKVKKLATGYTKKYKAAELATVKIGLGSSADKVRKGEIIAWPELPGGYGAVSAAPMVKLPTDRTLHVSTEKAKWWLEFTQYGEPDSEGWPTSEVFYSPYNPRAYKAGKKYTETFNTGVFGPLLGKHLGVFREDNRIYGSLYMFADGQGNYGGSEYSSVKTTLHQGDTKIGENQDPLFGEVPFTVGAADAEYTLATSIKRDAAVARASSRIDGKWTFRSKKPVANRIVSLPVSMVRFGAELGLDGTAPAGKTQSVPVTVQGPAAGKGLKSLSVYVSYDGKSWKKLTVTKGKVNLKNPGKGKSLDLRTKVTDTKGNKGTVTIHDAYFGK